MKRLKKAAMCILLALSLAGCAQVENKAETQGICAEQTEVVSGVAASEQSENSAEDGFSAEESLSSEPETEEKELKLYFNDTEIPVTWENNAAVLELSERKQPEAISRFPCPCTEAGSRSVHWGDLIPETIVR